MQWNQPPPSARRAHPEMPWNQPPPSARRAHPEMPWNQPPPSARRAHPEMPRNPPEPLLDRRGPPPILGVMAPDAGSPPPFPGFDVQRFIGTMSRFLSGPEQAMRVY